MFEAVGVEWTSVEFVLTSSLTSDCEHAAGRVFDECVDSAVVVMSADECPWVSCVIVCIVVSDWSVASAVSNSVYESCVW